MQKHFDKHKKDAQRFDSSRENVRDDQRKKKLKPVEKSKYKSKTLNFDADDE